MYRIKLTKNVHLLLLFSCLIFSYSCVQTDSPTASNIVASTATENVLEAGDIIVVNDSADAVIALDSNGAYKETLFKIIPTASNYRGLAWSSATNEVLVIFDHTTAGQERIYAYKATTGATREWVYNSNLQGTLAGLAVLTDGSVLASEGSTIEKFSSSGARVSTGGWPITGLTTSYQVAAMSNGNFLNCNTCGAAAGLRIYNGSTGATVSTVTTASTATCINTYIIYGCMEMSNGSIATAQNGATDTIRIYNSGLTTSTDFSDTNYLGDPRNIAQRANGNLLITDGTFHHIVEITSSGQFVQVLAQGLLNTPTYIMVVPTF